MERAGAVMRFLRTFAACCSVALACAGSAPAPAAEIGEGVRLSGDLRLRSESHRRSGRLAGEDYSRGRVRVRLGLDATLDERWDLCFRFATGGGPTSTNQDLNALNDDKAEFYVDRAFVRFHSGDAAEFELLAGRMPRPYLSTLMLWDSDYNPDGLAEKLAFNSGSSKLFLAAGQHVLGLRELADESKTYGPGFIVVQPGVEFKMGEADVTLAAAYYSFVGVADLPPEAAEVPRDHAVVDLFARAKWSTVSGLPLSAWLHALTNLGADENKAAVGAGLTIGSAKGPGRLRFGLDYFQMDSDAVWVGLADGTLTGGLTRTDMDVVRLGLTVGVGEGTTLGVRWWCKDDRYSDAHEDVIQIDLIAKF